MIQNPMDILERFPIRKTKQQKTDFLTAVTEYAQKQGYPVCIEEGKRGLRNVVIGDLDSAKYLISAHYDTPASIGLPNIIAPNHPLSFYGIIIGLVFLILTVSFIIPLVVVFLGGSVKIAYAVWCVIYFGLLVLMRAGPANRHNANDNTSGIVTLLEILTALPEKLRNRVCFALFDLEEAGLVGSADFRKRHKEAAEKLVVLNMDCVGDGDIIQLSPIKKAREDKMLLEKLEKICGKSGKKELRLRSSGFFKGSSDYRNFPKGIGIMAYRYNKVIGLYCGRIHTWRDTILEEENVMLLRDRMISLISEDAV